MDKRTMKLEEKYIYRTMCCAILAILATGSFFYVWFKFVEQNNQTGHLTGIGNLVMAAGIYVALYIILGKGLRAFRIGVDRKAHLLASQVLTLFSTDALEILISCAITGQFRYFTEFLSRYFLLFLVQSIALCFLIIPLVNRYRKTFPPLQILEVYGDRGNALENKINGRPDKYHVARTVNIAEGFDKVYSAMTNYDAVLINDIQAEQKNKILKECFRCDKRVYFTPKISDIISKRAEEINLFDTPLYLCRNNGISPIQLAFKRFLDILFSLVGLVLTSPILLVTAIAIKLEDGGPVFFRQERATLDGKKFSILKFRSMIVNAEQDGRPHPAGENDDRITKVGRVIRSTRIDELPQLINIIKGDMSLVGPRPERIEHVRKYMEDIPEFSFRLKVKAGLTGPAQVFGMYSTQPLDKLKMDLFYITNYSLLLDIQIIFETVKILFQKDSTTGFTEEQQKEMHDADL